MTKFLGFAGIPLVIFGVSLVVLGFTNGQSRPMIGTGTTMIIAGAALAVMHRKQAVVETSDLPENARSGGA